MTQAARLESLEKFRAGTIAYLLATDVAARGLDIQGVQVRSSQCAAPGCGTVLKYARGGKHCLAAGERLLSTVVWDAAGALP